MRRAATGLFLLASLASPAAAHSASRGFVLLLPTHLVILGGAAAVLITFVTVSALPDRLFECWATWQRAVAAVPQAPCLAVRAIAALLLAVAMWIGFTGPHDPAANLLPLSVWTLWWVVIVLLHPLFGNLWSALNPLAILARVTGAGSDAAGAVLECFAYAPAVVTFAAFAWFQLVHPGPEDPETLAMAVTVYVAFTLVMMALFGATAWFRLGDPFAIFLRQLGAAAPLGWGKAISLRLPGAGLLSLPVLPRWGITFVLLTLSSISFDAFANSFLWLQWIGVNPLDFPGRTSVMGANTLGLAASFAGLAGAFTLSVAAGWSWAGRPCSLRDLMGRLIYSLIPISIVFHFAHYLGDALVNLQYVALALNDPFGSGANLLGLAQYHVTASFQNTASGTFAIFATQTVAVIVGHLIAVAVAHAIVMDVADTRGGELKLEAPLAAFMVLYTAFGLWLLSTPAIS